MLKECILILSENLEMTITIITMYTHVSKCKNDKIKFKKNNNSSLGRVINRGN
jgi:hypothetical protein